MNGTMQTSLRSLTKGLSLGLAAFGMMLHGQGPAHAEDTITVAVPTFLTGPAAGTFGVPGKNGAELVIEAANAGKLPAPYNSAGFGGATAKVEFVDEAGGNSKQVAEFRNLVEKRKVDVVAGYVSSGSCVAVTPLAEELKQFTVYAVCGTPRIFEEADREYVFRTDSHAISDSVAAAHWIKENWPDLKEFTGFNQNYAFGQDSWHDFTLAMKAIMPDVKVSDKPQWPKLLSGQSGAEISALLTDKAELVHSSAWGNDIEGYILQGTPRGIFKTKKHIMTVGGSAVYRMGANFPDGVVVGDRGPYGILVRDRHTPLNDWFMKAYEEKYGEPPVGPSYQYAQAILGVKVAYDKAREKLGRMPSADDARAALTGLEYDSFSTHVSMSLGKGHQAVTENGLVMIRMKDGKPTVEKARFYPPACVNPPEGVTSEAWLEGGLKGAKCD